MIEAPTKHNFDYKQFFEMSPDLLCMLGGDGFFKVLNEKWTSLLGYSAEELTKTPFIEFVHPDDHGSTAEVAGELLATGSEVVNFTNRYICKNESLKWISWSAIGIDGQIYAVGRDVTDLKSKSIQFDAVQSTAKIGTWILDVEKNKTEWTAETYRIHELEVGSPIDMSGGLKYYHPDDRHKLTKYIKEAQSNLKVFDGELRFITAKGKPLWVRLTGDPVVNKNGEVTHLRGILQDITEKKRAELEIESQRSFLQSIINNIPAMIFAKSATELRFTLLNKAGEKLLGLSEADVLGKNDYDFFPKEQADSFIKQDREALSKTEAAKMTKDPIDTKNGRRWLQSLKVPVKNNDGDPELLLGISMDITAQVNLEAEVKKQQSFAAHQSKLAQVGQLAAGVGHEVNNPLTIAVGSMALIQKRLEELGIKDEGISELIEKHNKSTNRICSVVDGLRTIARIDSDDNISFSLTEAARSTSSLVKVIYENAGVDLTIKIPDEEIFATGQSGKFQQILLNLLSNAKDAVGATEKPQIEMSVGNCGDMTFVRVKDNGPGITPNEKEHIFDAFFTTKQPAKGTGLGLSISSSLVEAMKGSLVCHSEKGAGALFEIQLPKASAPLRKEESPQQDEKCLSGTVLIVDDEEDIRELLAELLQGYGCEVDTAGDGIDALKKVETKKYDTVITDLKMPLMNGYELIKKIADLELENTPSIFAISGGVSEEDIPYSKEKFESYIQGIIPKPFNVKELIDLMGDAKAKKTA